MARGQMHSDEIKLEQKPTIRLVAPKRGIKKGRRVAKDGVLETDDLKDRSDTIVAEPRKGKFDKEYMEELAFMAEPVTIILNPSTSPNAATVFPVWVNGEKAPMLMPDGRWRRVGWLPVGEEITIRRDALEIIARAKINNISIEGTEAGDERNEIRTFTAPVHSFSIIEDNNPRGREWLKRVRSNRY